MRQSLGWPDALSYRYPSLEVGQLRWRGRDWPVPVPLDAYLASNYGEDWREPRRRLADGRSYDKRWFDTQVSCPGLEPDSVGRAVSLVLLRLVAALEAGKWEKALALCDQVLAREPDNADAKRGMAQIAEFYRKSAQGLCDRNFWANCAVFADEGLKAEPENAALIALRDLSAKVLDGTVVMDDAPTLPDEDVIARLVSVRGIGRWTAEMYLMFELRRPDVWPVDDLGVRQGYGLVFGVEPPPPARRLGPLGDRFRPYRSVAARYMWEAVALHRADATTELR